MAGSGENWNGKKEMQVDDKQDGQRD